MGKCVLCDLVETRVSSTGFPGIIVDRLHWQADNQQPSQSYLKLLFRYDVTSVNFNSKIYYKKDITANKIYYKNPQVFKISADVICILNTK